MHRDTTASPLTLEGRCPECAGPYQIDLWDHSHLCEFCGSLLVFTRDAAHQVFVVIDEHAERRNLLEILIQLETIGYRSELEGQLRSEDGRHSLTLPHVVDGKAEAFERELRASLVLGDTVDFFAPYQIAEETVLQGVLGRRRNGPKESFLQSFLSREIVRRYDGERYNLRDRGLKIRAFRLSLLADSHVELVDGRFLPVTEQPEAGGVQFDRSRVKLEADVQVVTKLCGTWRPRELTVYKHLTYASVLRSGCEEHYLLDRQFHQIAGRLDSSEAAVFKDIPRVDVSAIIPPPDARALSAQCPDCGWELVIPEQDRVAFCATCLRAILVTSKSLETIPYGIGELPPADAADCVLGFPFWAFPFQLTAQGREYRRIWDWLAEVLPDQRPLAIAECDPEHATLFIPARNLYGTPELDRVFNRITGWVNWRQPALRSDRPTPDPRLRMIGAEIDREHAAGLAPFSLLGLHDNWSTRRLNAMNFKQLIVDADLRLAEAKLAVVPLPIREGRWEPAGVDFAIPIERLLADAHSPRRAKNWPLI